jgi:hypothetical protein
VKVYLEPPAHQSRGLERVADGLRRTLKGRAIVVENEKDAHLVVIHAFGRSEHLERDAMRMKVRGQKLAVIQYALRTTLAPYTFRWSPVWSRAEVVYSFLDLAKEQQKDKDEQKVNHYCAPLGVDERAFNPAVPHQRPQYRILTSGFSWLTESVKEATLAAKETEGLAAHIGADLHRPDMTDYHANLSDATLAKLYARTEWVSGLRRVEGFELPAAEGLVCGARPVLFDAPHYRRWYGDWADYVKEGPRYDVQQRLTELFKQPVRSVSPEERADAAAAFSWPKVLAGFWERCL